MSKPTVVRASLVALLIASAGWLASRTVLAGPDEEAVSEESEEGRPPARSIDDEPTDEDHRAFLAVELADGVSVGRALTDYLSGRAADESIRLRAWSVSSREEGKRYVLEVEAADGGGAERIVFDHNESEEAVEPVGKPAARLVAHAETLAADGRPDVLPMSFVPEPAEGESHWTGRAKKVCAHPSFQVNCPTMERFFEQDRIIWGVADLFAAIIGPEAFSELRQSGACTWRITHPIRTARESWATHRVVYGCGSHEIRWNYNPETGRVTALDDASHLVALMRTLQSTDESESVPVDLSDLHEKVADD